MDKRSLWQRKALNGSRLRLLIWGVLAAFLVVVVINRGGLQELVEHGVNGFLWNDLQELKNFNDPTHS